MLKTVCKNIEENVYCNIDRKIDMKTDMKIDRPFNDKRGCHSFVWHQVISYAIFHREDERCFVLFSVTETIFHVSHVNKNIQPRCVYMHRILIISHFQFPISHFPLTTTK